MYLWIAKISIEYVVNDAYHEPQTIAGELREQADHDMSSSDMDLSMDSENDAETPNNPNDFDFDEEMAAWASFDEDMEFEAQVSEDERIWQFDEMIESHIEFEAWKNRKCNGILPSLLLNEIDRI